MTNMPRFTLLTASNPKTMKGEAEGYATAILHLAPADLSGRNVCGGSSPGCVASCLNTAGQGGLMIGESRLTYEMVKAGKISTVQAARIRRTYWLFSDRKGFIEALIRDLRRFATWSRQHGFKPTFRPNGTSDLDFFAMFASAGYDLYSLLEELDMESYDYTKVLNRQKRATDRYHLTFSLSENNEKRAVEWLKKGGNVAVVFNVRPKIGRVEGAPMITHYEMGGVVWQVIDGDKTDLRFRDPKKGVIVGLRGKANARKDTTGFVRKVA